MTYHSQKLFSKIFNNKKRVILKQKIKLLALKMNLLHNIGIIYKNILN